MSPFLLPLLLLAGLSEAVGRLLPVVSRRSTTSVQVTASLLLAGAVIESTVIFLWPLLSSAVAQRVLPADAPDFLPLGWTIELVAPLILSAVRSLPLLGPLLHVLLLCAVGATLAGPLADASGLSWGAAGGCLAISGTGLAAAVEVVRRLVAHIVAVAPEPAS